MGTQSVVRYILIAIISANSSLLTVEGILQCPNNGAIIIEKNEEYPHFDRLNDTHIRGCEVTTHLKKCCGRSQIMVDEKCQDDFSSSSFKMFSALNISESRLVYGNGCPKGYNTRFYPGDYTNVRYHIQRNDSLAVYFDAELVEVEDFCLEWTIRRGNATEREQIGLLICIPNDYPTGFFEFPLGMALSLPFLISTLVVYSFRELRNIHSKNLNSHVASLIVAYLSVIILEIIKSGIPENVCIFLGLVRQFSFLSSFFWLNVMCFDLWWTLSNWSGFKNFSKDSEGKKYLKYSICGWGCPTVIILVTIIMDFISVPDSFIKPGIEYPSCFLQDGKPFYAYFYGPVIFIFCVDIILIILSGIRVMTVVRKKMFFSAEDKTFIQNSKRRCILLLKIFAMMGNNWLFDPFSNLFENPLLKWFFINFSITFQAVSIFAIFVWKKEIKRLVISKFCSKSYGDLTRVSHLYGSPIDNPNELKQNEMTQTTNTAC